MKESRRERRREGFHEEEVQVKVVKREKNANTGIMGGILILVKLMVKCGNQFRPPFLLFLIINK